MFRRPSSRAAALAAAVSLQALLFGNSTLAQSVQIFEQAPSIDELRKILIPETGPGGLSRRIELPRRDALAGAPMVRPTSMTGETGSTSAPAASPMPSATPEPVVADAPTPAAAEPVAAPRPMAAVRPMPRRSEGAAPAASRPSETPVTTAARPETEAPAPAAGPVDAVAFRINFALNSAVIPAAYETYIDRVGELMQQEPRLSLQIAGHTDASGPDQYNLELSERRALAVARYLVARHGIAPDRLQVAGKGKAEPLLDNPYDARNRRVQFMRAE